ncbi:MAG: glycosyltransferase family 4 protein [Gammaproteobacteria bacterium]
MRILHVTPTYLPFKGGIETFIYSLCTHLKELAGIDSVVCICTRDESWRFTLRAPDAVPVVTVPVRGPNGFKFLPTMTTLVSQADIVHLHEPQFAGIAFHFAVHDYGVPVVASTHGGFFHTRRLWLFKRLYSRTVLPWILRRLDLVIASSESDERTFRPLASHLVRVDNGVNFCLFHAATATKRRTAQSFVYFGRLSRNKRIELICHTLAKVRREHPSITLHLIGEDFDRLTPRLKKLCADLGICNIVHFHGAVEQDALLAQVSQAQFFISATEYEGFGLAIIEAMAAGCIPVVSRIAPLTNFIVDGQQGFLVDFSDPDRAADKISKIIALNESERSRISQKAAERAQDFSWDRKVNEFIDAYQYAAARRNVSG